MAKKSSAERFFDRAVFKKVDVGTAQQVLHQMQAAGTIDPTAYKTINNFMHAMWDRGRENMLAQGKRQVITRGMRAGGMPGTNTEATGMLQVLVHEFSGLKYSLAWDKATAQTNIRALADQIKAVNQNVPGKLVVEFTSGGPFLYPNSGPADFAAMMADSSRGGYIWRSGRGPDHHPAYVRINLDPARIIIDHDAGGSSWVVWFWLYQV